MIRGCIRVLGPSERWQLVAPKAAAPVDTVRLVREVPEFLGMHDENWGVPHAAVVAPGATSGRVLVAVDGKGTVQLVVCPQQNDSAGLSGLVADLLATAGRLWHQPYDALTKAFEPGSLVDRLSARVGRDWNVGAFRSGVEASLSKGQFPVLVVVRELSQPVEEMLGYLGSMNIRVRLLGYRYHASGTVEFVQPVVLAAKTPGRPEPEQVARARPVRAERRPEPARATAVAEPEAQEYQAGAYPPFLHDKATPRQQEILAKLVQLDELRLARRGLEYFAPASGGKEPTEGSIVVAVEPDRWPFPKPDEVIVVVNTGPEHLAGYLKVAPDEIREFLGSLPRVERKEHKGCVLLRAGNIGEALQLVNELRALKEVSLGGIH